MSRNLGVRCIDPHSPFAAEMPHGGFGRPAYGQDLSGCGLADYTRVKRPATALRPPASREGEGERG
jgi:betaine-aldehyde dehydrogenase